MNKFVVRAEYRQRNRLQDGYGSPSQSQEMSLDEARDHARKLGSEFFNIRIFRVEGNDGANYPLQEVVRA